MSDESTRDLLVRAGIELLEEAGTTDISLRAIARRAGVSHGAPRRWFPTHRNLLASIAEVGLNDLASALSSALQPSDTAADAINLVAKSYVSFATSRPAMFTLIFRHDLLEGSGRRLRNISRPMFDQLVTLIRRSTENPEPEIAAATLWTGIHGIAVLAASGSLHLATSGIPVDELIRRMASGAISTAH